MNIKTTPVEQTFPVLCIMHLDDDSVNPNSAKASEIFLVNFFPENGADKAFWVQRVDGSEPGWFRKDDGKIWQDYKPLPKGFKVTIEQ